MFVFGVTVFRFGRGRFVDFLQILCRVFLEIRDAVLTAETNEPLGMARLEINVVDRLAHSVADQGIAGDDTSSERISGLGGICRGFIRGEGERRV